MPGAGKSVVLVETAQEVGYNVIVMGDIIREEATKRGLDLNPTNVGKVMLELRNAHGNSVIADKCVSKIEQKESQKVIVDGIRSLHEVNIFKKHFSKFILLAIHASPETRFQRLFNRGRTDDPNKVEVFNERDMRELGVGIGNAIAMAQYIIINEKSQEEAKNSVKSTLMEIESKWESRQ